MSDRLIELSPQMDALSNLHSFDVVPLPGNGRLFTHFYPTFPSQRMLQSGLFIIAKDITVKTSSITACHLKKTKRKPSNYTATDILK